MSEIAAAAIRKTTAAGTRRRAVRVVETRASHRPPAHTATTTAKSLISAMTGVVVNLG